MIWASTPQGVTRKDMRQFLGTWGSFPVHHVHVFSWSPVVLTWVCLVDSYLWYHGKLVDCICSPLKLWRNFVRETKLQLEEIVLSLVVVPESDFVTDLDNVAAPLWGFSGWMTPAFSFEAKWEPVVPTRTTSASNLIVASRTTSLSSSCSGRTGSLE